jgi:exoribonuclease R
MFFLYTPLILDHDVALSFETLGPDSYQVGLHVADFSAFVKPQSPLDKEARDRASGIYLHQSIPLWPEALLEHCTNLVPDKDR